MLFNGGWIRSTANRSQGDSHLASECLHTFVDYDEYVSIHEEDRGLDEEDPDKHRIDIEDDKVGVGIALRFGQCSSK